MVEDVLVQMLKQDVAEAIVGLNPCCGGRCSSTQFGLEAEVQRELS